MTQNEGHWEAMTRQADPPADRAVAAIIGPWSDEPGAMDPGLARLAQATRLMFGWTTNATLATWAPESNSADPQVVAALRAYLDETRALPAWARPADIDRAEEVFMDYGPLSCTLLFCASLPECYVLPHLSQVLHVAGQLEAHTEHRIRQTAAMVFPVMMEGGLATEAGCGVAQVLKVRLIHATIRHLILGGLPSEVHGQVDPLPTATNANLYQAMLAKGWDVRTQGVPCNQLELAYTLLTFSYVFLKAMHTLGVPISREEEEAYLHSWNVTGHVLGIRDDLMVHTMKDAEAMFKGIQAMARARPAAPDVRPGLGRALVDCMARVIGLPVIRQLPVPLTRWLVGRKTAREIGVTGRVGLLTLITFVVTLFALRGIDAIVRLALPRFSFTRMFTRIVGYHFLTRFLLDQTRPLGLPEELLGRMHGTVAGWGNDPKAPRWINRLEDRMTVGGDWRPGQ